MNEEDLTPHERDLMSKLRNNILADEALEEKVIQRLRDERLFRSQGFQKQNLLRWAAMISALMFAFVSGLYTQIFFDGQQAQYNYVLLLHQTPDYIAGDPAQRFVEYGEWMRNMRKRGMDITGEKLEAKAWLADQQQSSVRSDDLISGFFMINASSDKEVQEVVRACPHLKYGGAIEIRKIVNQ